jgi:N-methylhydantoinase A
LDRLRAWFSGPIEIEKSAEMRYGEQVFEVDVPLSDVDLDAADLSEQIEHRFHHAHKDLYTYSLPDEEVVLVNDRVAAVGMVARTKKSIPAVSSNSLVTARKRKAYFGEWRNVDVYAAEKLQPGDFIEGPAIVEAETTTVILNVGDQLTVDERGWLDIKVATATRAQPELALSA